LADTMRLQTKFESPVKVGHLDSELHCSSENL
jgi:hypothetical protein